MIVFGKKEKNKQGIYILINLFDICLSHWVPNQEKQPTLVLASLVNTNWNAIIDRSLSLEIEMSSNNLYVLKHWPKYSKYFNNNKIIFCLFGFGSKQRCCYDKTRLQSIQALIKWNENSTSWPNKAEKHRSALIPLISSFSSVIYSYHFHTFILVSSNEPKGAIAASTLSHVCW